jgi:hypothetical protein
LNTAISSRVNTERYLNGNLLTSKNNRMFNNVFYNVEHPSLVENKENFHDYNLISSNNCSWIEKWQKEGWDTNSQLIEMEVFFNKNNYNISINSKNAISVFNNEVLVGTDFFGNDRKNSEAGPIINLSKGEFQYNFKKK